MNIISYVVKTKAVDTGAARYTYGLFNLLILKNRVRLLYIIYVLYMYIIYVHSRFKVCTSS